jgi:hypothetical protein
MWAGKPFPTHFNLVIGKTPMTRLKYAGFKGEYG